MKSRLPLLLQHGPDDNLAAANLEIEILSWKRLERPGTLRRHPDAPSLSRNKKPDRQ
jgi:hypothetical protein